MKLIRFLKSKTFFANLIVAAVLLGLLFWGFNSWLYSYTRHGEDIKVPDLYRLSLVEAEEVLNTADLQFSILDSAEYDPEFPRGAIVAQYPDSGSTVKPGRMILLTINPVRAKKINLPDLVDKTKRRAIYDLESKGFKVGELEYVPYIGKDVVVRVKQDGQEVKAGTPFEKGTEIVLVLGQGLGKTQVKVPYLKRLTLLEAEAKLFKYSLNKGAVNYDENIEDTATAVVFDQYPAPSLMPAITMGQQVDIWLTNDYTKLPADTLESQIYETPDSLKNAILDSIQLDTAQAPAL